VLIASDLPLQGGGGQVRRSMADAIRFVLRRNGYRPASTRSATKSCDDSTAQFGGADYFKCASNAKAYSQAADLTARDRPLQLVLHGKLSCHPEPSLGRAASR
jgi:hypothetical protein